MEEEDTCRKQAGLADTETQKGRELTKRKRPQSLHEKLWVLAVCDNMKIVDVPEEGRRCFIFREPGPERKRDEISKQKECFKELYREN